MGSLERKMERNRLKQAHRRLKKQWRQENERRMAGVMVPDKPADTLSTGISNEPERDPDTVAMVPMVQMRRLPLLGRPPSLGQYKKMTDRMVEQQKLAIEKQKQDLLKQRDEEEKKMDLEWKEQ